MFSITYATLIIAWIEKHSIEIVLTGIKKNEVPELVVFVWGLVWFVFCIYLWYRPHLVSCFCNVLVSYFCNVINLLSKVLLEPENLTILTSLMIFCCGAKKSYLNVAFFEFMIAQLTSKA